MSFGSARFSAFLDAGNVDQKRDQIFSEIYATPTRFIVQEIEPKFIFRAEIAAIGLAPRALEIRTPEIGFIGFKTKDQAAESSLKILARQELTAPRGLS
jgi:hypothetical protein